MVYASLALFFISIFAVLKAPAKPLWYVALGATEWGHYLVIASLAMALISWRLSRRMNVSVGMALMSAILCATPLIRAMILAPQVPGQISARFGNVAPRHRPQAPPRISPLSITDLFLGVSSPSVRVSTHVYATLDGKPFALDLYQPEKIDHPLPLVLVVHSGSWKSGDRSEFTPLNKYLAARGYIVASMDYRLAPASIFPAQKDDVFSAISFFKNHAAEIGWDKKNIVLLGRSAGGQIALSAAYAGKEPTVRGVISIYAPNDLVWGYSIPGNPLIMNSQKVIEEYLGGKPTVVGANYEAASPLLSVNQKTPPTLMIHGVRDELVWALHEERLSKRLAEAGRLYYYLPLPWATHGCDANFAGPSGQITTYAIERFLAAVMP